MKPNKRLDNIITEETNKLINIAVNNNMEFQLLNYEFKKYHVTLDMQKIIIDISLDYYNYYLPHEGKHKAKIMSLQEGVVKSIQCLGQYLRTLRYV